MWQNHMQGEREKEKGSKTCNGWIGTSLYIIVKIEKGQRKGPNKQIDNNMLMFMHLWYVINIILDTPLKIEHFCPQGTNLI